MADSDSPEPLDIASGNTTVRRVPTWAKDEFSLAALPKSINAAVLLYMLEIMIPISFAALIFSGALSNQFSYAITFVILGDLVLIAVVSLFSSYPGSMAVEQDTPGVILSLAAAVLVTAMPPGSTEMEIFSSVMVLIIGMTLTTGLIFLLLGRFRLGALVRFLPYPVMGGFLAGTGWLLAQGGVGVMTESSAGSGMSMLARWLPGLLLGVVMVVAVNRWNKPMLVPALLLLGFVLFYGAAWLLGYTPAELSAAGWLIGPFPENLAWRFPLTPDVLSQVNWQAIAAALPTAAPAILISMIALLLNASSLELVTKRDMDLNRELMTAGAANLASGLVGGLIGYHAISLSTLNHTITRGRRLPGLLVALMLLITLAVGMQLIAFLPRMLLGSLLVFIGLALLYEWVYQAWFTFPRIDYAIIVSILVTIVLKDFLWGIALGMVLTIIMFVISYSRSNIIKHELSGLSHHSRFNRNPEHLAILQKMGDQLYILTLQGFIFFGSANFLYEKVRQRVRATDRMPVRYLLIDLELVTGLDSTGMLSFQKLHQFAGENGIEFVMTGLKGPPAAQFKSSGFDDKMLHIHQFSDLDRGVEWCEDSIIAELSSLIPSEHSLQELLAEIVPDTENIEQLIALMDRLEVAAGEYLIRQGEAADEIFFLESGQISIFLEQEGRDNLRLQTVSSGNIVGELAFYLGVARTASVVVDLPSVVYRLTRQDLENCMLADPAAALTLHQILATMLSKRVLHLTVVINALQQ